MISLITIIVNIILLCLFVVLYFFKKNKSPKQRALVATLSGIFLVLYIICLFVLAVEGILNCNYMMMLFFVFAFIPFVIGQIVRFETLSKFLLLQISAFALSLVLLIIK